MTDPSREDAEDAAQDYSDNMWARRWFVNGWLRFFDGGTIDEQYAFPNFRAGYIAARDAPE